MSDFGTMKTRIADEMDRSDLTSQIALAVQDAIKLYAQDAFWFNEVIDEFDTVNGTEYYTLASVTDNTTTFTDIIDAVGVLSGGTTYPLDRRTFDVINAKQHNPTTSKGAPLEYCIFNQQMRLWPVPDGVYTVKIAGIQELSALSADVDTNAWMVEAEPLIRHKAMEILYRDIEKNDKQMAINERTAAMWFSRLQARTNQYVGTGHPTRTYF